MKRYVRKFKDEVLKEEINPIFQCEFIPKYIERHGLFKYQGKEFFNSSDFLKYLGNKQESTPEDHPDYEEIAHLYDYITQIIKTGIRLTFNFKNPTSNNVKVEFKSF